MSKDWQAVAKAVNTRMDELGITQAELVRESRVAPMTVQTIRKGEDRNRSPHTLAAISTALRWPPGHLEDIADGSGAVVDDDVRVTRLESEVAELRGRVEQLEADR